MSSTMRQSKAMRVVKLPGLWLTWGWAGFMFNAPTFKFGFIVAPKRRVGPFPNLRSAVPTAKDKYRMNGGLLRVDVCVGLRAFGLRATVRDRSWRLLGRPDWA